MTQTTVHNPAMTKALNHNAHIITTVNRLPLADLRAAYAHKRINLVELVASMVTRGYTPEKRNLPRWYYTAVASAARRDLKTLCRDLTPETERDDVEARAAYIATLHGLHADHMYRLTWTFRTFASEKPLVTKWEVAAANYRYCHTASYMRTNPRFIIRNMYR